MNERRAATSRESVARRTAAARGHVVRPRTTSFPRVERVMRPESAAVNPDAVRGFARQVALATAGPCFRYSQRLQLLALAGRAGISRFDANLIIAAIEHRAGAGASRETVKSSAPKSNRRAIFLAAAGVQLAVVAAGWLMLFA